MIMAFYPNGSFPMQRDFDLVITLLASLREAPTRSLTLAQLLEAAGQTVGDVSDEQVSHHLDLLHDADLVKPLDVGWRLTWHGYDALEQGDDEDDEGEDDFDD